MARSITTAKPLTFDHGAKFNVIEKHFTDLQDRLSSMQLTQDVLSVVTNRFFEQDFINQASKDSILNTPPGRGADLLLNHLYYHFDLNSEMHWDTIYKILKEQPALEEIADKMNEDYYANKRKGKPNSSPACDSILPTLREQVYNQDDVVPTIDDAAIDLESAFAGLKSHVIGIAPTVSSDVDFIWFCEHVRLRFQSCAMDSIDEVRKCYFYQEVEKCLDLKSLLKFLFNTRNIFGYLNLEILLSFKKQFQGLKNDKKLNNKFESYERKFNCFIQNSYRSIIEVLQEENPIVSPDLGLPEIKLELDKSWLTRSLAQWNEAMENIVEWREHLMIQMIECSTDEAIVIKYYFLSMALNRVANDILDKNIVRKFSSLGAKLDIDSKWLDINESQNQAIMSQLKISLSTSNKDQPLESRNNTKELERNIMEVLEKRLSILKNEIISRLRKKAVSPKEQMKMEEKIRESLNISQETWFPKTNAKDVAKKIESYYYKVNDVLQCSKHNATVSQAKPFIMKGILLTGQEEDLLKHCSFSPLLQTNKRIYNDCQNYSCLEPIVKTFHNKEDEEKYFKLLLNVGLRHFDSAAMQMENTMTKKSYKTPQSNYLSTVKVFPIILSCYNFNKDDLELTPNAKKAISKLDEEIKKNAQNHDKIFNKCCEFFYRYGSHISSIGPVQEGAVYWVKCYTDRQTSLEKLEDFHKYVVDKQGMHFIPVLAMQGSKKMKISDFAFLRHNDISAVNLLHTYVKIENAGGKLPIDGNEEWILGHLRNYYKTTILDHGEYIPVWDVINTHYHGLNNPEKLNQALKNCHFQLTSPYKFLSCMKLEEFYYEKLTLQSAITNGMKEAFSDSQLPWAAMSQKIMHYNSSAFEVPFNMKERLYNSDELHEGDFEYPLSVHDDQQIHPISIFIALFLCSNRLLQREILCRISICQFAIPFIFRNPFTQKLIFPLWAMRSIIKKIIKIQTDPSLENQNASTNEKELEIVEHPMPIVSFLRIGNLEKLSKSKIMNDIIDSDNQSRFFHRDLSGGSLKRQIGNGMIDMSWYLTTGRKNNTFSANITFLNLHGNSTDKSNENQVRFLSECSSICIVLVENEITEQGKELIESISKLGKFCFVLLHAKINRSKELRFQKKNVEIIPFETTNAHDIKQLLQNSIAETLGQKSTVEMKISSLSALADKYGIEIDENCDEIQNGKDDTEEIITKIASLNSNNDFKSVLIPLQGEQLWHGWVKINKEKHRMVDRKGSISIKDYIINLESKEQQIIKKRREYLSNKLHPTIKTVIAILQRYITSCEANSDQKLFIFFQNLKLGLTNLSQNNVHQYWQKYLEISSQYHDDTQRKEKNDSDNLRDELGKQHKKIIQYTFGLEHILREIAHVYVTDSLKLVNKRKYNFLARAAAKMMIQGHPLELMDGDAAYVQIKWIKDVLRECTQEHLLGKKSKIYILSILGVQSVGKSTLLNTMFGLQFNIGAGRCTQGAYMQFLRLPKQLRKQLKCDYIVIIDTEGLCAPELDSLQTNTHDRELATFVIGIADMTLIKLKGEVVGEMNDIIQTAVLAFIRMRQVNLKPRCKFIFPASPDKKTKFGENRFVQNLNKITSSASRDAENQHFQVDRFSEVIEFNSRNDIHHLGSSEWKGGSHMAPINIGYSESVESLKNDIFKCISEKKTNCLTLSQFSTRLDLLWKSLLSEDFVFNFKNAMHLQSYKELERARRDWEWNIQQQLYKWYEATLCDIDSTEIEKMQVLFNQKFQDTLSGELNVTCSKIIGNAMEILENFFKNHANADILVQWEAEFKIEMERFINSLKRSFQTKCKKHMENTCSLKKIQRDYEQCVYNTRVMEELDEIASSIKSTNAVMTEKELSDLFDSRIWNRIKKTVAPAERVIDISEVEIGVETELIKYFEADKSMFVKSKLSDWSEQDNPLTTLSLVVVSENHIKKSSENASSQSRAKFMPHMGKRSIEINRPQDASNRIFNSAQLYLDSIKGYHFKPIYVREMLNEMKKTRDSIMKNEKDFELTEDYWLDACVIACKFAEKNHFKDMVEKLHRDNDPLYYLENEKKKPLLTLFISKFRQQAAETRTAKLFCEVILNNFKKKIKTCIGFKIVEAMKNQELEWSFSKRAFKAKIMIDMAESKNFESFITYLTDARQCFQLWTKKYIQQFCDSNDESSTEGNSVIQCLVFEEIPILKDFVISRLNKVQERFHSTDSPIKDKDFLNAFCTDNSVKKKLGEIDSSLWKNGSEVDVKSFYKCLKEELNMTEEKAREEFKNITYEHMMEWDCDKPDHYLLDKLGCCEQCPFCGEICENNSKHSDNIKHNVEQHRSGCLGGYRNSNTNVAVIDICTTCVSGEGKFKNAKTNNKYHPYSKYSEIHPDWHIKGDLDMETSTYWKWFVAQFMPELAKYYSFIPIEVPESWKELDWSIVKETLLQSIIL